MSLAWTLLALSLFGMDEPLSAPPGPNSGPPKLARPRTGEEHINGREDWRLSLPEAIKIGLDNDEITRRISLGVSGVGGAFTELPCSIVVSGVATDGIAIAPVEYRDADVVFRFKSEVMAEVRSFEARYWELVAAHAKLKEAERLVEQSEEIIQREQSELESSRAVVDFEALQRRLEKSRQDLAAQTSATIQAERRLRDVLGLPLSDGRRIVPTTVPPADAAVPDGATCGIRMMESHPEIAYKKRLVDLAVVEVLSARNQMPGPVPPRRGVRSALYRLNMRRESLDRVVQEAARTFIQCYIEAQDRSLRYQKAVKAREDASKQAEAQETDYEEGRITIDRYLDHLARRAGAANEEAEAQAASLVALAALDEATGTLLDSRKIFVVGPPRPRSTPAFPSPRN